MALTRSVDRVDETGRELLTYGTPDYPIAFFDDDLSRVAVPPHWHDEFEIVIVTKGIVHAQIAGSRFALTAGEGYFVNTGILHSEALKTKTGRQRALIFSPRMISQAEDMIWQLYVAPVLGSSRLPYIRLSASVPWQKEFLAPAERAWRCGAYDRENYPIEVRDCLSRALSLIGAHADVAESELRYTGKYRRDELRRKPPSGIPQSGRQFRADAC